MWLAIGIVFLSLCLVIGPVMLMRPSRFERRRMGLREQAGVLGLKVRLAKLPTGEKNKGFSEIKSEIKADEWLAVYSMPWQQAEDDRAPWLLRRQAFAHDLHFCGVWDWCGKAAPEYWFDALKQALGSLPEEVLALENGPQGLGVFWTEKGAECSVEGIQEGLQSLQNIVRELRSGD